MSMMSGMSAATAARSLAVLLGPHDSLIQGPVVVQHANPAANLAAQTPGRKVDSGRGPPHHRQKAADQA